MRCIWSGDQSWPMPGRLLPGWLPPSCSWVWRREISPRWPPRWLPETNLPISKSFTALYVQRALKEEPGTYYGLQAAEDGSVDQHLADLHVDRQTRQVVSQRGEQVVVGATGADLPQQVDGVADRLGLRGIEGPAQELLRGAVLTFLLGESVEERTP